jgi:hypothetical protein
LDSALEKTFRTYTLFLHNKPAKEERKDHLLILNIRTSMPSVMKRKQKNDQNEQNKKKEREKEAKKKQERQQLPPKGKKR